MDFDTYYQELYGDEWSKLKDSLLQPRIHVARLTHTGKQWTTRHELPVCESVLGIPGCYDPISPEVNALLESNPGCFFLMDLGSVLAAHQLSAPEWQSAWDMCAAPGGKSLILLEQLTATREIQLTDLSRPRLERLKQVIRTYHDTEVLGLPNVRLTATDSVNWGYRHQNCYDAVLLDAPCSSERHVMADESALAQWKPNRVKSLVKRQYGLLCSAVLACRPGGRVLYSTCSVNPAENDGVIDRYLKKKKDVRVCPVDSPLGHKTEHGVMIRPDRHDGWGPLYFSLLQVL